MRPVTIPKFPHHLNLNPLTKPMEVRERRASLWSEREFAPLDPLDFERCDLSVGAEFNL